MYVLTHWQLKLWHNKYVSLTGNFGGGLDTADRLCRHIAGVHSVTASVLPSRDAFIYGSRILQRFSSHYFFEITSQHV
jgi:hypothetical protein